MLCAFLNTVHYAVNILQRFLYLKVHYATFHAKNSRFSNLYMLKQLPDGLNCLYNPVQ